VGDNQNDITDTKYGNNNVMGPDKEKFFMERTLQELLHRLETTILEDGIANNVEILTVRAVPTEMSMIKILHLVFVMQLIMAQK
jgi:hypothetical protein